MLFVCSKSSSENSHTHSLLLTSVLFSREEIYYSSWILMDFLWYFRKKRKMKEKRGERERGDDDHGYDTCSSNFPILEVPILPFVFPFPAKLQYSLIPPLFYCIIMMFYYFYLFLAVVMIKHASRLILNSK